MNELIPTIENENGNLLVSGRDLHEFLEVKSNYSTWFERMAEYGFVENADYFLHSNFEKQNGSGGHNKIDHAVKVDMAKEISMLQRNEKGKQARQYFLDLERHWNSPEMIMKRAMQYLDRQIEALTLSNSQKDQLIGEIKPKADYTDTILKNKGLVSIGQIAKDYGMSANRMNKMLHDLGVQYKQSDQWLLYAKHHDKGYTHSETYDITRTDGRSDVKMNTKWTQKGRLFIYELLKKNGIKPMIERSGEEVAK